MKKIAFNIPGAIIERSPDGKLIRKACSGLVELPYSEENLQQAERQALPGTVQILAGAEVPKEHAQDKDVLQCIRLADRATGKIYELYIENGQLMKEVL